MRTHLRVESPDTVVEQSSLSGALSALSSDKGFLKNSQQMLDKSIPTVFSSMSKTSNYILLPEKNVTDDNFQCLLWRKQTLGTLN